MPLKLTPPLSFVNVFFAILHFLSVEEFRACHSELFFFKEISKELDKRKMICYYIYRLPRGKNSELLCFRRLDVRGGLRNNLWYAW